MARLDHTHQFLTVDDFEEALEDVAPDCLFQMTVGLSSLELALLVSMSVLEQRDVDDYSFSLIYSEYYSKMLEVGSQPHKEVSIFPTSTNSKATCLRALENLVMLGLVAWHSRTLRSLRFHPVHIQLSPLSLNEALREKNAPSWLQSWLTQYSGSEIS